MITKDLGLVTAYAYAVSGGYTGTEAEFTELLGNIAKDLEEIEDLSVTVETLPPGSGATASYADGVLHLGIPRGDKGEKGDKGDKGDKGETGETGPQGPKGDPGDVSTEQLDEAISDVRTEMEESYARNDGYYEEMTVGDAEQLISTQFVEDTDPYLFRPTGGSADVGNREYLDKIVGGTVGWNQLVHSDFSSSIDGWSAQNSSFISLSSSDGVLIATYQGGATQGYQLGINPSPSSLVIEQNHKIILTGSINVSKAGTIYFRNVEGLGGSIKILYSGASANTWHEFQLLANLTNITVGTGYFLPDNIQLYSQGDTFKFKDVKLFDLTQMFGTTIADYIYSLEQSQAGAGVAWFRNYFPKDYYPYDPGTLRSVEGVSAHETVGFNQWDEEWESGWISSTIGNKVIDATAIRSKNHIPVLPNTTYYAKTDGYNGANRIAYYDENKQFLDSSVGGRWAVLPNGMFTTPKEAHYMMFCIANTTTYNHDICINLSDPTRNGEYEPYTKHTYPLDSSLTLRGVPKLVDGKLAFDGDVYPPSGEVQRRYGIVDLSTFTWTERPAWHGWRTSDALSTAKRPSATQKANAISTNYKVETSAAIGLNTLYSIVIDTDGHLLVRMEDGKTASDIKGYLVYEKATPTTETAEGYEHYQICDPSGTEEFVTTGIVPVGHETRYPANLRDKLQHLPDLPSPLIDGAYMVMVSGSQMHLERFLIPDAPTEDGTYTLKATVSGGTPTYTWEVGE